MSAETRLQELGFTLPPAPKPVGVYRPIVEVGSLVYLSGHGPLLPNGTLLTGRVGDDVNAAAGYDAARQTGLAILATLQNHLGSLDRVTRVVKVLGMVNSTPDFHDLPGVINGFSELMRDIFGPEAGIGARSAIGVASLPGNMTTEVEAILEIR